MGWTVYEVSRMKIKQRLVKALTNLIKKGKGVGEEGIYVLERDQK